MASPGLIVGAFLRLGEIYIFYATITLYNRAPSIMSEEFSIYFKNKKITMLGLGILGRGVNVAKFLAEQGALLTITDLKTEIELESSISKLKKYKNISFVLGRHRLSDFKRADMVIKAASAPLESEYLKEARRNKIPIYMDASLFAELAPRGVIIIGITGTRGKSTVTHLIHHILSTTKVRSCNTGTNNFGGEAKAMFGNGQYKDNVFAGTAFLGGNVRGIATLPLLKKIRPGDAVIMELDSWQLQGFGDAKLSPHIAVFTNFMPDHMNYYKGDMKRYLKDKVNIFTRQNEENILIIGSQVRRAAHDLFSGSTAIRKMFTRGKGSKFEIFENDIPKSWKLRIPGVHNRYNAALAISVCRALGISDKEIKKGVESFNGVSGRLEFVRRAGGVKYYNDTTATTPSGLYVALESLAGRSKNIVLIAGGNDKELQYDYITKIINKTVKALVLIDGTATKKILNELPKRVPYPINIVDNMKDAVMAARQSAQKGDTILLSPGATSFGVFINEFDRGDQFVAIVKKIV